MCLRNKLPVGIPGYVGCHAIGAIMGLSPYQTEYDAYLGYIGQVPEPDDETKKIFRMGHRIEDLVADCLKEWPWNLKVKRDTFCYHHPNCWKFICHPDRVIVVNGKRIGIEIKSSSAFDKSWGSEDTSEVPYHYLLQCLGYIACGVCDEVWLFRFSNNKITRYIIKDNKEVREFMEKYIINWINRVDNGYIPNNKELRKFGDLSDTDGCVPCQEDWKENIRRWKELKAKSKELELETKALGEIIQSYMGEYRYIVNELGDKVVEQRTTTRRDFDKETFKLEHNDLYGQYQKESKSVSMYNAKGFV